jgi:hypothetical protein
MPPFEMAQPGFAQRAHVRQQRGAPVPPERVVGADDVADVVRAVVHVAALERLLDEVLGLVGREELLVREVGRALERRDGLVGPDAGEVGVTVREARHRPLRGGGFGGGARLLGGGRAGETEDEGGGGDQLSRTKHVSSSRDARRASGRRGHTERAR